MSKLSRIEHALEIVRQKLEQAIANRERPESAAQQMADVTSELREVVREMARQEIGK